MISGGPSNPSCPTAQRHTKLGPRRNQLYLALSAQVVAPPYFYSLWFINVIGVYSISLSFSSHEEKSAIAKILFGCKFSSFGDIQNYFSSYFSTLFFLWFFNHCFFNYSFYVSCTLTHNPADHAEKNHSWTTYSDSFQISAVLPNFCVFSRPTTLSTTLLKYMEM